MKTLFDDATRAVIQARLQQLTPDKPARWGKFTPATMLAHLIDSFESCFLERAMPPAEERFINTPLGRWLIIDSPMPWPRNSPTSPEYLKTKPQDFARDKARVLAYLDRFAMGPSQPWGHSPGFGVLTAQQWAKLSYRHVHHHLTQFGV